MKKVFSIIAVAVVATSFVACGPSAEDKAKMEARAQEINDSVTESLKANMQSAEVAPANDTTAAATASVETAAPATEVKK